MSTSQGTMSRKIGWFKSLCAKVDRENKLLEKELKEKNKDKKFKGGKRAAKTLTEGLETFEKLKSKRVNAFKKGEENE